MSRPIPPDCGVAFKEWDGLCQALRTGRQALILRKGGIAEEQGDFRPEHPAFWLYPTALHQTTQGLKDEALLLEPPPAGQVLLDTLAVVERLAWIDDWERLALLDDLHVWHEETVRSRFRYRHPGLWVLGVRIHRRDEPYRLTESPEYLGCKSWVPLGRMLVCQGLTPALDDAAFEAQMQTLQVRLGPMREPSRVPGPESP